MAIELWASAREIWVTAVHIPGSQNVQADATSSKAYAKETEWKLHEHVFHDLNGQFRPVSINLFASRTNAQCDQYVSWKPDPFAIYRCFSLTWCKAGLYAFLPFSVIGPVLTKVVWEKGSLLIVLLLWPSEHWFPQALQMSIDHPRILPTSPQLLSPPHQLGRTHPFIHRLHLTLFNMSGQIWKVKDFQQQLPPMSPMEAIYVHAI